MIDQQPLVEGNLEALEHGSNSHGELLAAIIALDQASAVMSAFKAGCLERTTMSAERTVRPLNSFQMLAGCIFVGEAGRDDVHEQIMKLQRCFVKYIISIMCVNLDISRKNDLEILGDRSGGRRAELSSSSEA